MIKTIRCKLFLSFTFFIVVLVFAGILGNSFFLENFYIYKNQAVLEKIASQIKNQITNNPQGIVEYIQEVDRNDFVAVMITNKNIVTFSSKPSKMVAESLPREIEIFLNAQKIILKNKNSYAVIAKENDINPKLCFISQLGNDEYIVLTKQLKGIRESVFITNQFNIITGILLIIIGGITMFYLSGMVTKPIIQMSQVAESITQLNFEKNIDIHSKDELGILANSINQMSEKIKKSITELKNDIEQRKELVRSISHELKTPIGVIKGYAEGLQFGVVDSHEKQEMYLATIVAECGRIDKMINDLLTFSCMEYAKIVPQYNSIMIKPFIESLLERFYSLFNEQHITVECTVTEFCSLFADYGLIERAMSNYIVNALHYVDEHKIIRLGAKQNSTETIFWVYNSGEHIPESEMLLIWNVFYKVDKNRSRTQNGSGLGLAIVKSIAVLHGGTAYVENSPEGVTFYLVIPHK